MNSGSNGGAAAGKRNLVYIMSPSYAGSTLLTFLLATHPKIATIGELKATSMGDLDVYNCSCGKLIKACGFWRDVQRGMAERGRSFSLEQFGTSFESGSGLCNKLMRAAVRGGLFETARDIGFGLMGGCRKERDEILMQNREIIDLVIGLQEGDTFLDGSKDPVRLKLMHQSGLWNIKVINLVRDGRGATNSIMKHYGVDMEEAVNSWVFTSKEMQQTAALFREDEIFNMKYEDLCRDPDRLLSEIYRFVGVDPLLGSEDFRGTKQHILGNAMRLNSTGEIRLDEKWKEKLTEAELEIFGRIGGEMNRFLGYQ
ncbi:Sulfotransferase domain [endosymbiont of Ridgeia piscesae]|uniref:Sulfotransferase domain n=2 Tax=endosymbiont of Ridgeia piscesae TaxID=54398 RepID=A0A0T5YYZ5_9GAMM|nr:sulfotransferase [endosymbiont of Ridgeia piscesae]KRT55771.1 Sulfotransferase domain [endosymbiont of Ridgeia piscesae]